MSRWTHIAGLIRIDALFWDSASEERWLLSLKRRLRGNLPEGSEGPVNFALWLNPDGHSLARGHFSIWGDLREFGTVSDIDGIIQWLNKSFLTPTEIIPGKEKMVYPIIRQGILQIEDEYKENSAIVIWDEESKLFCRKE